MGWGVGEGQNIIHISIYDFCNYIVIVSIVYQLLISMIVLNVSNTVNEMSL